MEIKTFTFYCYLSWVINWLAFWLTCLRVYWKSFVGCDRSRSWWGTPWHAVHCSLSGFWCFPSSWLTGSHCQRRACYAWCWSPTPRQSTPPGCPRWPASPLVLPRAVSSGQPGNNEGFVNNIQTLSSQVRLGENISASMRLLMKTGRMWSIMQEYICKAPPTSSLMPHHLYIYWRIIFSGQ